MKTDGRIVRYSFRSLAGVTLAVGLVLTLSAAGGWAAPGGGTGGYKGGGGSSGSKSSGGSSGSRTSGGSSSGGSHSSGGFSGGSSGGSSGFTGGSPERTSYTDYGGSGSSSSGGSAVLWVALLGVVVLGLLAWYFVSQRAKQAAYDSGGGDWGGGTGRRAAGPSLFLRRKREADVVVAAESAAMDDAAFLPETVKAATRALHKAIVEAWTARDREKLATLVGPDLMVEWNLRLDDFDRKGWHNITELLSEPAVEYLGLVNREGEKDDRVTVRIEAEIRDYTVDADGSHLLRTDETDEVTRLPEFWTLGRHDDGAWYLVSIEQDAEGGHALGEEIVARPDEDTTRLHDEAVAQVAVVGAVPDEAVKDIAPIAFDGDARTAALDMANVDGRFDPDVLEASARRAVAAWAEAVDGDDAALAAVATPDAVDKLLYGGDTSRHTRLVVRGPVLNSLRISAINAQATPATMTVEASLTGRRYRENRDTTIVVNGSKDKETTFTESWTMALDGNDTTPWRLVGSNSWG